MEFSSRRRAIATGRLMLKTLGEGDMQRTMEILADDRVRSTYMVPDFSSREEERRFFSRLMELSQGDSHFLYGIYLSDVLIGIINDSENDGDTVELGYALHPEEWGKGYATEALSAVMEELRALGCRTLKAGCFVGNTASSRVMEKCGLTRLDGESSVEYRGKRHPVVYYGIRYRDKAE